MATSRVTRVAVVTGSNKGIGLAIVRRLCKEFDGEVILTSRDERLGKKAIEKLEAEGLKPKYHQLDITSSESIDRLKQHLVQQYGGLDVLVNNAAVSYRTASTAPILEQATVSMATNFTGTRNITRAVIPILRPHARIVNISSSMLGALSTVQPNIQAKLTNPSLTEEGLVALTEEYLKDVAAGDYKEKGWASTAYGTSKLVTTVLTKVHARELESDKDDILVNCCCPGLVKTDMSSNQGSLTPDQGAETPVLCALLPAGSPTGELWKHKKVFQL